MEVCRTSVSPNIVDQFSVDTIVSDIYKCLNNWYKIAIYFEKFINNEEEVTTGDDTMFELLSKSFIIEVTLRIDEIVASDELKTLKPKSRKCLFYNEPQSKYFDVIKLVQLN